MSKKITIDSAGVGRQTNPTPVLDTRPVQSTHDDVGRQVVRLWQVRDLVNTASASLTNGTPTSLHAGVSGALLDLKQITCANNSDAAVTITLSDDGTTVRALSVPANNSINLTFDPPLKQGATGSAWQVDMPDITGTTVSINAEFLQEV